MNVNIKFKIFHNFGQIFYVDEDENLMSLPINRDNTVDFNTEEAVYVDFDSLTSSEQKILATLKDELVSHNAQYIVFDSKEISGQKDSVKVMTRAQLNQTAWNEDEDGEALRALKVGDVLHSHHYGTNAMLLRIR